MNLMKKTLSLGLAFLVSAAEAQEYESTVKEVVFNTSSKTVINKEMIEKSRSSSVVSLLATQGNIVVAANPFQPSSIYIRGSDAGYVLILVDGVPVYDASTTQRTLNLGAIDIRSVEKIEILKGGQSVLYGGQAAAGVIKITTVNPTNTRAKLLGELNQFGGVNVGGSSNFALSNGDYLGLRLFGGYRENKSPVKGSSKEYPANQGSADLIYQNRGENVEGVVKLSHFQDDVRLSTSNQNNPSQTLDSDNFKQVSKISAFSVVQNLKTLLFKPRLAASYTSAQRDYSEKAQTGAIKLGAADVYKGLTLSTRADLEIYRSSEFNADFGLSSVNEELKYERSGSTITDAKQASYGAYLKGDYKLLPSLLLEAGLRYDRLDVVGERTSSQVGLVLSEKTRLEYSTSFRNPSLFHLYSNYGNKNLKIEQGQHFSLSHDVQISENSLLSGTAFYSDFKDMISITGSYPNFIYKNISKAEIKGVELNYSQRFNEEYQAQVTLGYQEPWDKNNGKWLSRRPLSSGSLQLSRQWETHSVSTQVRMAGSRYDGSVTLPGYAVWNAAWNEKVNEDLSAYLRVDNILDHRYEEFSNYYNRGVEALVGFEYLF